MYMYTFFIEFLGNNVLIHTMCTVYFVYGEQLFEGLLKIALNITCFRCFTLCIWRPFKL
jgi:hypothetical protein